MSIVSVFARLCLAAAALTLWVPAQARAWVLQAPAGADFFELPGGAVLCGAAPDGFLVDTTRSRLRPRESAKPGTTATARVAQTQQACAASTGTEITLLVTADHPELERDSVVLSVDSGRLEVRGRGLEGMHLGVLVGDKVASDVCLQVSREREREHCAVNVPRDLPADPRRVQVFWAPAQGRVDKDMVLFDARGRSIPADKAQLPIARIQLQRVFLPSRTVDLSRDQGGLPLAHPEAVASAECGLAHCEVGPDGVLLSAVPASAQSLNVRIKLNPRVVVTRGDAEETVVSETLDVLRCPLDVVSGPALRGVDDLRMLVRVDHACAPDLDRLRWSVNGDPAEVERATVQDDGAYVLLFVGRIASDRVTLVASRAEDASVVAVVTEPSVEVEPPTTSLTLAELGEIDFIPKNREAFLSISSVEGPGRLVPIAVPGAYTVRRADEGYYVRGTQASSGFTSLRFAYRAARVPAAFADTDLGRVTDPVQRPIREANVPAPIGASSITDQPVVELFCADEDGRLVFIPSGASRHVPFPKRNSCRLIFHRQRIPEESGEQRLDLTVTVTSVGGAERGEAHLSQQLLLRHGVDESVVWIRGAKEQFDRIDIRINHVIDESLYAHDSARPLSLPSSQWSLVTEDASFRFYATAAIPGALYRFSDDPGDLGTGPLSLNFGVLSRLTWLDDGGHEGLVGLEAGVMGMGLATDRERQLALVLGVGIGIPLGNPNQPAQAAINIHAWLSYTVGTRTVPLLDDMGIFDRDVQLNPWAFVFGPSITVGSIGVFL